VVVEVVIRNADTADRTFEQHRLNIYDYWPETTFQVTTPGGTAWTLQRPVGAMDEFDKPGEVTLKPGESYAHAVRIDRWQAVAADPRDQYIPPRKDLFVAPGEYAITARYVQPKSRIRSWAGSLASGPAKLT